MKSKAKGKPGPARAEAKQKSKPKPLVFWDSCVFIHRLQGTPEYIELLEEITQYAAQGKLQLVSSVVAITEVLKLNGKNDKKGKAEQEAKAIRDFFENDYIDLRFADLRVARDAADLRSEHGLKTVDSLFIATAIIAGASAFQTYDKNLLSKHEKCGKPPLKITLPEHPEPFDLIEKKQKSK